MRVKTLTLLPEPWTKFTFTKPLRSSPQQRQQRVLDIKSSIDQKLIESGERDRLKELLRTRLIECGWRDEMKATCKDIIKDKGVENVTIDELIADLTPRGRDCHTTTFPSLPPVAMRLPSSDTWTQFPQADATFHGARNQVLPLRIQRNTGHPRIVLQLENQVGAAFLVMRFQLPNLQGTRKATAQGGQVSMARRQSTPYICAGNVATYALKCQEERLSFSRHYFPQHHH
ncbi:hypothetical protein HPB48_015594 [Haemaphysalis longicornis]|uniref:Transcription and mRNA export factor ENY2 n=1 Tax=Haemaphysalis longicornis TaxID=44386 RepID=A0A9J6FKH0_HAELO|nr:hypothetical protein HPB48_015594 [Haemaphysalis longicornis]